MVKDIISLVRPQQWLKNVFIFLPIFFSRKLGDGACLSSALIAFVIYCLVAGSIYCLNDICDRESDRLHPTKCRRPIASGAVSVGCLLSTYILSDNTMFISQTITFFLHIGQNIFDHF